MRAELAVALVAILACASASNHEPSLTAPFLHPTARVVFPATILNCAEPRIQRFDDRDFAAHYSLPGISFSAYVYPASSLLDHSVEAHFQEALKGLAEARGVRGVTRFDLSSAEDVHGAAIAAKFEIPASPPQLGLLSVHQACSHMAKFRVSCDPTIEESRCLKVLVAVVDAVIPRDFQDAALGTFGPNSCTTTIHANDDRAYGASSDGCVIHYDPRGGPAELSKLLCAAIDARVRSGY
jgi:hypothetical protein